MKYTIYFLNSIINFSANEVHTIGFNSQFPLKTKCVYNLNSSRRNYSSTISSESTETALVPIDNNQSVSPDKCFYKNIITVENLELGLKRTKVGVSAGLDGEVKANYANNDKIAKLSTKLKSHQYKPSPTKKV
jgi:hypothetical protein